MAELRSEGKRFPELALQACEILLLCLRVTFLILVLTLAGGVVLGLAPALLAASTVVRTWFRSGGGRTGLMREGWRAWKDSFWRAQVMLWPVFACALVGFINYQSFSQLPGLGWLRVVSLIALIGLAGIVSWMPALWANYEIRATRCLAQAARFALARPIPTVLLVFTGIVLAVATKTLPGLMLVTIGGWSVVTTYLALRFFQENEDRLAGDQAEPEPAFALPHEPLNMH